MRLKYWNASVRTRAVTDTRTIARLGGPLLANNLAIAGMSFADTIMAGQLGARDLAGLAIGAAWFNLFLFIGLGFMAMSPTVAHAYGAGNVALVVRYVRQSWWLALALSVVLTVAMRQAERVLPAVGISPDILPVAIGYANATSWGVPALMGFFALRFASEGLGQTRPIMYIAVSGLLLNILGNWVFMYGKFGMPRLGAIGCGVATAIGLWMEFLVLAVVMDRGRFYRGFAFFTRIELPNGAILRELLRLGMPIAGSILAEGGVFVAAALLMGAMGATIAAAHQIALNYASFMFMVPLAISSATTIHVGQLLGAGEVRASRFAGLVGIVLCACVMLVSAAGILLLSEQIAALYSSDPAVRSIAATLLLIAALFQLSDGLQVGAAGALRGFKDTAVPLLVCVFSYWIVGFSLAYVLGVQQQLGPVFVWLGLTAGLSICAALLVIRYRYVAHRAVAAADSGGPA